LVTSCPSDAQAHHDHGGFGAQPEAFAAKLDELFMEADSIS
jgi:hypothetical protein